MSRDIDAATAAASKLPHVGIIVGLMQLGFDSGDVLVTDAPFPIAWDWDGIGGANTFIGVGQLGKVSKLEESVDVQPYSISSELSGIDPALVSIALAERYQGRAKRVWVAFLNQDTHAIIGAPLLMFRGRLDTMRLTLGKLATIFVTAHSRLADWARARMERYTNEGQQKRWPSDKGLEFAAETSEKELLWGTG